ncbi:NUDIX domain-containing protein [Agrobacterium vitis]|uniref:NUDIX domain-containing protein n=1 Tax=Agrobacterium vitis TaxID=373 RepID=A0AAE2RF33_AGRVI|nr:NUDIX domain-containing protein [Agrobacterium vitis]MBF2715455.1 NUDIX domain-containing protein [Agrobacterium vitis]MUZ66440.1 NUDIX domain-containing protein [Agrobacterium vitis]
MAGHSPSRVRVILLSPLERLLLIRYRNTDRSGVDNPCWTTTGGGIEPGETIIEAALREITEETGLVDVRFGPVVWYGEDSRRSGDWGITFKEHFIVAHSTSESLSNVQWTRHEHNQILEMRWWSIQEIENSSDVIYPIDLHRFMKPIFDGDYPIKLFEIPSI